MNGDLQITCPKCGHGGRIPAAFAGHLIHCKHCDEHFPILSLQPTEVASILSAFDDDVRLAPISDEEEKHCRERYENRVLPKFRKVPHEHEAESS